MKSKKKNQRKPSLLVQVSKAAKKASMFLLVEGNQWRFYSGKSGKYVLTWFRGDGNWTTWDNRRGRSASPFAALKEAVATDNQ